MPSPTARILELRGEREELEARLAEITSDIDLEVVRLSRDGVSGQEIATACGWSKQRVSQIRARALANAEPDLGPGGAEMALHRREIASKGGRASAEARRTRMASTALLDAFSVPENRRSAARAGMVRGMVNELRPLSAEESLRAWLENDALARA